MTHNTIRALKKIAAKRAILNRKYFQLDDLTYMYDNMCEHPRRYGIEEGTAEYSDLIKQNNAAFDEFYAAEKELAALRKVFATRKGLRSKVNLIRKYCDYQYKSRRAA